MAELKTVEIASSADTRLELFALRRYQPLEKLGLIVIDSEKVILRAIKKNLKIRAILGSPHYIEKHRSLLEHYLKSLEAKTDLIIYTTSEQIIAQTCGHYVHQGMIALAEPPRPHTLDALGPRIVVLNKVMDAQNIGTIIRNAMAFGLTGILSDAASCPIFARRAIRVSMGSVFHLNYRRSTNLADDLQELKKRLGVSMIGTTLEKKSTSLSELKFHEPFAVIIGNEDQGMDHDLHRCCDLQVRIPMVNNIDSLNAAQASAVIFYEMSKSWFPPST